LLTFAALHLQPASTIMSDAIKHECGLAVIRLRKPLAHYYQQYGTVFYGINKMYLLLEKQHNRGQDGAGLVSIKLDQPSGSPYMRRIRTNKQQPIADIMRQIQEEITGVEKHYPELQTHPGMCKGYLSFMGEVLMGHLRYGTQGRNNIEYCHPFVKGHTNPHKHLVMAGNFNLVNTKELFSQLEKEELSNLNVDSDLAAMIETVHKAICADADAEHGGHNWKNILSTSATKFDGGFTSAGICGNGDAFVMRDKHGIRPCFYFINDDIIAAASERAALMTTFNASFEDVHELTPGHALIVLSDGSYTIDKILEDAPRLSCSFERIYFSRGSDAEIYAERKQLGRNLSEKVLRGIKHDLRNTIFSFIPNTAESAFYGLIKGAEAYLNSIKIQRILSWGKEYDDAKLVEMIERRVRVEKIAIKDVKMRTFITDDSSRNEMVQHVYDITYGTVRAGIDSLVVIDDSIVRGTTLRESIIKMLDRLKPKKITIVSSCPQIRYPDCYGIDMSKMGEFIAFQAAVALLRDAQQEQKLQDIYNLCLDAELKNTLHEQNFVKAVYEDFTAEQVSAKIAQLLTVEEVQAEVEIIYQDIEGLHSACPNNLGDWYFTGNYPTSGGNIVVNKAFMNYMDGNAGRGY
jgi:amidophosphoribosyltransferase